MKKITLLILLFLSVLVQAQVTTTPSPGIPTAPITLNFNKAGTPLATYTGTIYAHIGLTVDGAQWQNVKGSWGNNTTQPALTLVSGTNYKLDITPDLYTYFGVPTTSTITQICVVFRAATGSPQSSDYFVNVGAFQVTLTSPAENSTTLLNSGGSLNIAATNTGGNASYSLKANGTEINANASTASYSFTHSNITENTHYDLVATMGTNVITKSFDVMVNPGILSQTMPSGVVDGITYNDADNTKATLVLNAPGKDFVYVAGSFNNYTPTSAYAMKKDPATGKFWLQLQGLTPGQNYTYQYWVVDQTPLSGTQALVKTADPFSTLVLSPFDDPYITSDVYPNLPAYPAGQKFEVSVLQTGQQAYNWQATNYQRPAKEKLIVYEALIRDWDVTKTWDNLSAKIDYLKNLHVNAIELMPVMEFEGNISWGYNTAFHMAPDKSYGTAESMKAFIDLCHQNGIAVILDVALNHVYGRSPLARMWAADPDGDGFGDPSTENPYCNTVARHSYSVGSDLNHQSALTQYYVKRTVEHWINEFNIDGFRWDLTKGFTQNCTASDDTCTNAYQADRVAILKQYADYQWAVDPNQYVIFEHLGVGGSANEEVEWANYRIAEGKGIMPWANFNSQFNQLTMGYQDNSNINNLDFENRGYSAPRVMGYAESHDEERLMYKNLLYGASAGSYNVRTLATALERQKAVGALLFTVPGPKMLWQFGELGYDYGINYCENATYNTSCRTNPKPIPSAIGYTTNDNRTAIYDTWAKILNLRMSNEVFNTTTFTIASGTLTPRIDIWNNNLTENNLKAVIVLANFSTGTQTVNTSFSIAGDWYNLMDGTTIASTVSTVTLQPGEFRIYGNKPGSLGTQTPQQLTASVLYPNPATNQFYVSTPVNKAEVYALTGQLVKTFGSNANGNSFDVSGLSKGIYLVKITDTTNRVSTVKLVKE
ncbi:alpha-amylase family glycosyl hydrolase [Flavobacterium sp. RNTU_13]|uniref:alpha-amylase family glycosyl hydrolase n=1 Tax=Flavobacterium sp. RNTU_13 TaxID=3375145 RepID=UPI0039882DDF